jgi:hypothetical protein
MDQGKRFGTFVIRYWSLPSDERRLDIEHVQSGERYRCASLPEAEAWLAARVRPPAPDTTTSPTADGAASAGTETGRAAAS